MDVVNVKRFLGTKCFRQVWRHAWSVKPIAVFRPDSGKSHFNKELFSCRPFLVVSFLTTNVNTLSWFPLKNNNNNNKKESFLHHKAKFMTPFHTSNRLHPPIPTWNYFVAFIVMVRPSRALNTRRERARSKASWEVSERYQESPFSLLVPLASRTPDTFLGTNVCTAQLQWVSLSAVNPSIAWDNWFAWLLRTQWNVHLYPRSHQADYEWALNTKHQRTCKTRNHLRNHRSTIN